MQLTPSQQQVLRPLAAEWDNFSAKKRSRFIKIADSYKTLTPQQQARVSERLKHWSTLSHEDRQRARENYKRLNELPPSERAQAKSRLKNQQELTRKNKATAPVIKAEQSRSQPVAPAPAYPEATKQISQ
ncbi:DUF3106 domain-containing protein [Parachitinimonas caeni]|uniref:DUF3106 domain-containing protein n=1 Tax=Parachitinimonas caeni TaxID=3031301 RepID=A0ABT7E1Y5_9NEIS|nr:DUF3106 domain-containing protein [Parachitinimonas caeni]MDK2126321.1 DUF3106 domain-containing protein [Parachitinimonas caeni]